MYASAQPIDFLAPFGAALGNPEVAGRQTVRATFRCGAGQSRSGGTPNCTRHLSVRRWAIQKWRGAKLYAPPFGAAPGNPEMAGHQTVRARAKNASLPNRKLQVSYKVKFSYVHPGFRMDTAEPSLRSGSRVTSRKRVKRWTLTTFRSGPHVATGSLMLDPHYVQVRA
ncbi:MAG: hypothetical protein ACLQVJ_15640 [Syntrophobacteraceae bacterium]